MYETFNLNTQFVKGNAYIRIEGQTKLVDIPDIIFKKYFQYNDIYS